MDKGNSEAVHLVDDACITEDGEHVFVDSVSPFIAECSLCQERYIAISESMAKKIGIICASDKPIKKG